MHPGRNMRKIPLTQGKFALVDDEDYEWLSQWNWQAWTSKTNRSFYSVRRLLAKEGKRGATRMHIEIMKRHNLWYDGFVVDHVDFNGLNNQKYNLRACTPRQNLCNRRLGKNNTSGYKGVDWRGERNRWRAQIRVNGKKKHLGFFTSKLEAAKAYNKGAEKYFGKFSHLNEVQDVENN